MVFLLKLYLTEPVKVKAQYGPPILPKGLICGLEILVPGLPEQERILAREIFERD